MNGALQILGMMPGFVDELDEDDRRLIFEREVRVGVHVRENLPQIIHLRRQCPRIGSHATLAEAAAKPRLRRVSQRVRPVRAVELNGTEKHEDPALLRTRDQVIQ